MLAWKGLVEIGPTPFGRRKSSCAPWQRQDSPSGARAALARAAVDPGQLSRLQERVHDLLTGSGIGADEKPYRWAMERIAQGTDEDIAFLHFICGKVDSSRKPRL